MRGESVNAAGGISAILTKVDKLRELVGKNVSLPQLVVVGDQSSGKSSVLEGITGFAFPRAAELCTRYVTQITCKREDHKSITASIIPHVDANLDEQNKLKAFSRTLTSANAHALAQVFSEVNTVMGIRMHKDTGDLQGGAFSEHILRIEICGPTKEHFTVIDVPGIFRNETEGLTTESDIMLVRNMVMNYMKDERTIILAIMPANVDPATQEILKLASQVDPSMTRTMGVLTKADLAIESTMQQIAIDLVLGKTSHLKLGYYIVKNRGPDDVGMSLVDGQAAEEAFFSQEPWSALKKIGRAGTGAVKARARELLEDVLKQGFPKLRNDIQLLLAEAQTQAHDLGPSRATAMAQRAYLGVVCDKFQAVVRDALNGNYTANAGFDTDNNLRLITRIMELNDRYSDDMAKHGHTMPFVDGPDEKKVPVSADQPMLQLQSPPHPTTTHHDDLCNLMGWNWPMDYDFDREDEKLDIMGFISREYRNSRNGDLGSIGGRMLGTIFKEQSKKWEDITDMYVHSAVRYVYNFIVCALEQVCPDKQVREELWNGHMLDAVVAAFARALERVKYLLAIERESWPITLNHVFSDNLEKAKGDRLVEMMKKVSTCVEGDAGKGLVNWDEVRAAASARGEGGRSNSERTCEHMHDVLRSYYTVARKRFVDTLCQQAVWDCLLLAKDSPLQVFSQDLVFHLDEDQLDAVAGESAAVRAQRERLERDAANYKEALDVLRGSSSKKSSA